ncbi:hypothetical protein [Streptomyces sp. NPDC002889]|uniref:hypothetical protein n=1 Tax=Streptomyces sp. NPDC002889 TaxID=3364669 RepID=UPI00367B6EB7
MPTEINPARPAMTDAEAEAKARQIIADFATSFRDDSPVPNVGTAPPVAQPGRPPMSQKATDVSALMLAGSVLTVAVGGTGSLVMLASGYADPVVCAIVFSAPAALVLAISRLVKRAAAAAPTEHHHHYSGPVQQTSKTVNNQAKLWGRSTTNL